MFANQARRAPQPSSPLVLDRVRERHEKSLEHHSAHPEDISARLNALDKEWDIERASKAGSSTLTLLGLVLGTTVNRKWFWLSAGVQGFCLQRALQGSCPPPAVLRQMGMRTAREIDLERQALLAVQRRANHEALASGHRKDVPQHLAAH